MTDRNNEEYHIVVENTQTAAGESTVFSESAKCRMNAARGVYYIKYRADDSENILTLSGRRASIRRTGISEPDTDMKIICETGKNIGVKYGTPYGTIPMKAKTEELDCRLDETGGTFHAKYILDVNGEKLYNDLRITIEKCGCRDFLKSESAVFDRER